MTSVTKYVAVTPQTDFSFFTIETPSYRTGISGLSGEEIPFPFSYNNGVLDIDLIDDFESKMITTTGEEPENEV